MGQTAGQTAKAAAIAFGMAVAGQAADADSTVVVELFTSQGCSSCPPADAVLRQLAEREDVIALALHVDYWDYIGWADSFADPAFTERQKAYARAVGERMVYTPQMIIGGVDRILGTQPMRVVELVEEHGDLETSIDLTLTEVGNTVRISAEAVATSGPCVIQVVRFRPLETVSIERGENAGHTLEYVNIVQSWDVVTTWDGTETLDIEIPRGDQPLAVLVQSAGHGPILAAAALR